MKFALSLILSLIMADALASQGDWVLTERFKKQLQLAEQGDAIAQYDVGKMYQSGRGISEDVGEAERWLNRSARQGNVWAKTSLGVMYFEGKKVKPNPTRAYNLLHSAASRDIAQAQFYLGRIYEEGRGARRDLKLALRWYERAATNGYYGADAKVASVRKQLSRSAGAPAAAKQSRPAQKSTALLNRILAGQWQRADKPAGYLPSRITRCKAVENNKALHCVSEPQTRRTMAAEITYMTHARLENFAAKGEFKLSYVNEIAEVKALELENLELNDMEDDGTGLKVSVKTGDKSRQRSLACRLESDKKLTCVRDQVQSLTFTTP